MGPVLGGLPPFAASGNVAPQSTGTAGATSGQTDATAGDGQGTDSFFALVAAMMPQLCQAASATPQLPLAEAPTVAGLTTTATTTTGPTCSATNDPNAPPISGAEGLPLPSLTVSPWTAWNASTGPLNSSNETAATAAAVTTARGNVTASAANTAAAPAIVPAPALNVAAGSPNPPIANTASTQKKSAEATPESGAAPTSNLATPLQLQPSTTNAPSANANATATAGGAATRIDAQQTPASPSNEKRAAEFAPSIAKATRSTRASETEAVVELTEAPPIPAEAISQTTKSAEDEDWDVVGDGGVDATAEHATHAHETVPADNAPRETVTPAHLAERVGERIAEQLPTLRERGQADIQMSVHPPELGKIQIHLTLRDGNMHVQMTVQDDTVKRLLDQQLEPLRVRMNELGVGIGQFDVRRDGGSPNQTFEQDMESAAASAMIRKHTAATSVAAAYGPASRSTALLDVFA